MATQEEWVFQIAKLAMEPGDLLVVSLPEDKVAAATFSSIRECLKRLLPGIEVLFKSDDISLSVLTRSQIEAAKEPGAFVRRRNDMSGVRGFTASQVIIDDPHKL